MIRYITTIIIVLALIFSATSAISFSNRVCSNIIDNIGLEIENINTETAPQGQYLSKAKDIWNDKKFMFSIIGAADKTYSIDVQFDICTSWSLSDEPDEYSASLWNLRALMIILRSIDNPSIERIF